MNATPAYRWTLLVVALIGGVSLAVAQTDQLVANDLAQLQGLWQPVRLERKGEFVNDSFLPCASVLIQNKRIYFKARNKTLVELEFSINSRTNPRQIDFTSNTGEVLRGIYSLSDNQLTLCWPLEANTPRPRMLLDAPDKDYAS